MLKICLQNLVYVIAKLTGSYATLFRIFILYLLESLSSYFNYVPFQENIKELVLSADPVCLLLNLQLERECCGILLVVWKLILSLSIDLSLKCFIKKRHSRLIFSLNPWNSLSKFGYIQLCYYTVWLYTNYKYNTIVRRC